MTNHKLHQKLMISTIIASAFMTLAAPKVEALEIYVNTPPPELRYEVEPTPRTGYLWVAGHWDYVNNQYVWTKGSFERERDGYFYHPNRYTQRDNQWFFEPSRWETTSTSSYINSDAVEVSATTPPPELLYEVAPASRTGYLWVPGHWNFNNNKYVWTKGQWEMEREGYSYYPSRWIQKDNQWVMDRSRWDRKDMSDDSDSFQKFIDKDREGDNNKSPK